MNGIIKKILFPVVGIANSYYLKKYYESVTPVNIDELVDNKNILVLSPHQDDESIGMGATIHMLHNKGCYIKAVYMTDGSMGIGEEDLKMSATRIKEARRVQDILGIDEVVFLPYKNLTLLENIEKIANDIGNELSRNKYDRIYTTALSEMHMDHVVTSIALMKAVTKIEYEVDIFMYEINNSLQSESINSIVFFDREIYDIKSKAMSIYKSQKNISFEAVDRIQKAKTHIPTLDMDCQKLDNCSVLGRYLGAEVFYRMSKSDFIDIGLSGDSLLVLGSSKYTYPFSKMKNATNFMRLIVNYRHNLLYNKDIRKLYNKK